jgi:hypothetical protein
MNAHRTMLETVQGYLAARHQTGYISKIDAQPPHPLCALHGRQRLRWALDRGGRVPLGHGEPTRTSTHRRSPARDGASLCPLLPEV